MRLLVCGGRTFGQDSEGNIDEASLDRLFDTLYVYYVEHGKSFCIIQGEAPGADRWAKRWAELLHVTCKGFPADWTAHGKAAGSIRNTQMLDEGKPDEVLACPGGPGTRNMIKQSRARGITVKYL